MPFRLLTVAALAAVCVLALVGCSLGGEDEESFAEDVVATRNDVDASLQHMADSTTYEMLIERLETASENIGLAADRIAESDPPDELRDERDQLERSYRALSEEVGATAEALEDVIDEDSPALEGINFTNWERVQTSLAELRTQGVEVPPLERY